MARIMPTESYSNTLNILSIPPLKDHHEQLCAKLFQSVVAGTNHKVKMRKSKFWGRMHLNDQMLRFTVKKIKEK